MHVIVQAAPTPKSHLAALRARRGAIDAAISAMEQLAELDRALAGRIDELDAEIRARKRADRGGTTPPAAHSAAESAPTDALTAA